MVGGYCVGELDNVLNLMNFELQTNLKLKTLLRICIISSTNCLISTISLSTVIIFTNFTQHFAVLFFFSFSQ